MKCPKCGFNSFEYYDSCKMCSSDLTGYKQTHSIISMVLPFEAKETLAAESRSGESVTDQTSDHADAHDDIFSFDLPDDPASSPGHRNDDPFNFDEPSPDTKRPRSTKSDEDIFADLLESTSQVEESHATTAKSVTAPVAANIAAGSPGSGEFDLDSFSWDDAPAATAAADVAGSIDSVDDFDSLFGETKEKTSK